MGFHSAVISFATAIFIVLVIVLSIIIALTGTQKVWPPEIAKCPDYWEEDEECKCINTKKLVDFKPVVSKGDTIPGPKYPGFSDKGVVGLKAKCVWAKKNNVFWSGITDVDNPLC